MTGKSTDRHRDRVEPGEHVGWEPLVGEHAPIGIPEVAKGFRVLQVLPMQSLQSLYGRQCTPVDGIHVPDGNGPHYTTYA